MRLVALLLTATSLLPAQDATTPIIRSDVREVLIDAVVRDRRGQLVRGLTAADFEVREDGVVQRIVSIRETGPPATPAVRTAQQQRPAAAPAERAPGHDALRQLHLVSMVFERLGPSSRRLAKDAALEMLKARSEPNTWYAVFLIQNNLRLLQTFTSNDQLLRAAIDRATGGSRIDFENAQNSLDAALGATRGSEGTAEALAASAALRAGVDGGGLANEQIGRMVRDMLEFAESSAREQQGRTSLYSLLAIANAQRSVPGRKTVLYFSEGLHLPNSVWHVLESVIGAANRANVSLYSIDARGLEPGRDTEMQQAMLGGAGANARGLYSSSTRGDIPVSRGEAMAADTGLDAIRANPQQSLRELAESTGGFLVANTNDLRLPVRRIAQETARYYEITYTPSGTRYDGQFRRIEVRVKRSGAAVHARSGYFAFPAWASHALFPWEIPLLKAAAQRPLPRGVDYRAAVLHFRPGPGSSQVALVTETALNDLTFRREEDGKGYRTHVSAVALLKDEQGTVAAKLARDLPVVTPAEKLDEFRRGEFILTQTADVPPGRYTLESAFGDRLNERLAARRSVFVVSGVAGGVRLSSLTLVRRVDATASTTLDDPFQVKGGRVIPWLADTVGRSPDRPVVVYFIVYPMDIAGEPPKLTIEIRADHTPVARVTPQLPEPLEDGSIRYVASAPTSALEPGLYEIRVTAEQAGTTAQESLFVTIE